MFETGNELLFKNRDPCPSAFVDVISGSNTNRKALLVSNNDTDDVIADFGFKIAAVLLLCPHFPCGLLYARCKILLIIKKEKNNVLDHHWPEGDKSNLSAPSIDRWPSNGARTTSFLSFTQVPSVIFHVHQQKPQGRHDPVIM